MHGVTMKMTRLYLKFAARIELDCATLNVILIDGFYIRCVRPSTHIRCLDSSVTVLLREVAVLVRWA